MAEWFPWDSITHILVVLYYLNDLYVCNNTWDSITHTLAYYLFVCLQIAHQVFGAISGELFLLAILDVIVSY